MKKAILLLVAVFAFSYSQAQFKGGIKGGLNLSQLDVDAPGSSASNKTGFHGGLFFEAGLAGFSIMPEILFSVQGSEFDAGIESNLSYVQIPVLLKKSFAKVLNVHLGPQFGILLTAEDENGNDLKDFTKSSDLALAFGLGVDLPKGISGGLRYVYGLTDINDTPTGIKTTSRTIQVYLGYKLFGM